uniref:Peptidase S1 domain-containing protein n=1 Tax=Romanomermis culicivorax TaxID=13658 RepID=A0A915K391_ROMCU
MNDSKYDIGMIKLHEAVAFNSYIRAIPLTNSTIDHVNDCALSGWGSSYTGDSGKWGPKSTLTTAIFPDIAFEDDELRHYEVLRSPVTHGDSGSALECRLMNQSIVQGIAKGKDMQRGRRFIIFSDINYLSEWIKLSFTKIDHHSQLAIYHWQLERYKNYEGSDLGAIDLEEQIRVQTGYILAKNFQREIFLNKSSEVHISKLWFTLNVDFHTDVFHNRFNLQGMRGYSVEYDVYNCAMLCYINNMNGSCSYAAHSKRCYYSDNPYEELQKMGHKITSYNSIGKRTHLNELMWNVSRKITKCLMFIQYRFVYGECLSPMIRLVIDTYSSASTQNWLD